MTNKPILLLQFRTDETLTHEFNMIQKFGHLSDKLQSLNLLDPSTSLPTSQKLNDYAALILGGSSDVDISKWNSTTRKQILKVTPLLQAAVKADFPTLGICFGHQLLAYLMGGEVTADATMAETGTYPVYLTPAGQKSLLFRHIDTPLNVVLGHKDSVTRIPESATILAYSDACPVQALSYSSHIFSVQFHPELDLSGLLWRLSLHPEYLTQQGKTLEQLRQEYLPVSQATRVISNFVNLVAG